MLFVTNKSMIFILESYIESIASVLNGFNK